MFAHTYHEQRKETIAFLNFMHGLLGLELKRPHGRLHATRILNLRFRFLSVGSRVLELYVRRALRKTFEFQATEKVLCDILQIEVIILGEQHTMPP